MKTTVKFVLSTLVAAAAMNSTMFAADVYVSSDYNPSTEGWGTTRFSSYSSALSYCSANNKKANIVIEKTNTISGNCIDQNTHKNLTSLNVIVKDGATLGNALSKWDMTYAVTVEAGGILTMARPANASVSNVHLKNALVIGEKNSTKRAKLDFLSDSYQDGDISIRYNGSLEAYNADITVQDLDAQGKMTLEDCTVKVDGALATATFYKTTLNRVQMTVGGTQISGGLGDFSGGATNRLGNFSMTDSTLTFGEGAAVKVAGTFDFDNSTLKAGALEIGTSGKFNVSGNSSLNISSVSGNAINIIGNTTLTDSSIGGNVAVGYGNYTKQPATLTLKGTSSISGALYVGDEKTVDAYKLNVNGSATIGSLYSRTESIVNVSEADLSIGYWQNKGKATIDNASVEVTGVNFYVYNNDSDSLASITLKNGATLTAMGLANNIGLVLGNTEATPAKGHAALYLEGGSTANLSELQLRPTVNGDKTYKIEVAAKEGSTINVRDAVVVGAGATISLTDSKLKATSVCGEGLILGNGTVNLNADSISTQVFVGGYYDAEGNRQYNDGEALRSKLVLDDVSGNGVMIKDKEFRVNNAAITLNADVTAELGDKYFYIRESVLDLNGHTVNLNTGKFIANGINIIGEGTINAMDSNDPACFQNVKATIGSGVTFNTHTFHAYTDLDLYGNASATGTALVGVNGKEPFDASKPWIDNANMTVWGEFNAGNMTIQGASGNIVASKLIVKDGGKVSVSGTLTNNGVLEVDANGTVTANAITGSGDVVLAGTINVVGGVFKADDLTIVAGATLNFGAVEKGVTLMATREVISFDFNTLTIIATDVKVGDKIVLSDVVSGSGADELWQVLEAKGDKAEFTIVDSGTNKEFTAIYDKNGGTVSVIPEPSMFGLMAGLGALVLVGTRRRRK